MDTSQFHKSSCLTSLVFVNLANKRDGSDTNGYVDKHNIEYVSHISDEQYVRSLERVTRSFHSALILWKEAQCDFLSLTLFGRGELI